MSMQVQCPNCGSQEVSGSIEIIHGKRIIQRHPNSVARILFLLALSVISVVLALLFALGVVLFVSFWLLKMAATFVLFSLALIVGWIALLPLRAFVRDFRRGYYETTHIPEQRIQHWTCLVCGNRWTPELSTTPAQSQPDPVEKRSDGSVEENEGRPRL
jgi:hypothetical protein